MQGTFTMRVVVTQAIGVRGEHRGERLTRTWRIRSTGCDRDACRTLHLRRTLSRGRTERISLHRRPDGTYVGRGAFPIALSCRGRLYRRGSRARYTIRLRVTASRTVGGIRFARHIRASYANPSRTDSTPCLLAPSHDAARYTGRLRSRLPSPPRASFTAVLGAGGAVAFRDTTRPGTGPGHRTGSWRWNFGDPGSGATDGSRRRDPYHRFSAPGVYRVTLTATDGAGLRSTTHRSVLVAASSATPAERIAPTARSLREAHRREHAGEA